MATPMHTPMKNLPKHDRFFGLPQDFPTPSAVEGPRLSPWPAEPASPNEAIVPFDQNRARVERDRLQIKADQIEIRKKNLGTRAKNRKDNIERIKSRLMDLTNEASDKRVKLAHESRLLQGNDKMLTKVDSELRDVNGMLASMPRYD